MKIKIKIPRTENERLVASIFLVFIIYFGLNSLVLVFTRDALKVPYLMSVSFFIGMLGGVSFFLLTRPKEQPNTTIAQGEPEKPLEKNIKILKKALTEDESVVIDLIKENEGITQDSLRFKTGFSKSKVSYLITELEKKDIIHRESLGRTYKLFISDWLKK